MEKRKFDKLGIETSLLGFGCMRFPTKKDGSIDEELAEQMLDEAYAAGVTYFDTAFPYHDGESEPFVGRVLGKYDRSSYYLATKLPIWEMKDQEDARQTFLSQLERLNTDYVDFYLLHAMDKRRFQMMKDMHILEMCEEMRAAGKIRYLGFPSMISTRFLKKCLHTTTGISARFSIITWILRRIRAIRAMSWQSAWVFQW